MSFRVVKTSDHVSVLSDKEWNAMSASEQAAYTVVQTGFATNDAAFQYAREMSSASMPVNRHAQTEDRDPRSERRR